MQARYSGRAVVSAPLAGFPRRVVAALVDRAVLLMLWLLVVRFLGGARPPPTLLAVMVLIDAAYYTWGFGDGQTVGCMLLHVRVVSDRTGLEPGYRAGLSRWVLSVFSVLCFGLGYLWMVCDDKHQTWHDKLCSTVVIRAEGPGPDAFFR